MLNMQEPLSSDIQESITKQNLQYRLEPKQMISNNPSYLYCLALNVNLILLNNALFAHKQ